MNANSVCMTTSWDDGHPLDLKAADLLAKYGLQGTFYIPPDAGQEVLTPAQIRQVGSLFEIGAHTVHHVVLTTVPDEVAKKEIFDSKQRLEDMTSKLCSMFCFPRGAYRKKHLLWVRAAGYRAARTVELLSLDFPRSEGGVQVMPTTLQVFAHRQLSYLKNIAKRLAYKNLWNYMLHGHAPDWVATAKSLLNLAVRQGGVFHLWGHSWEIEKHGQWRQLEEVLRFMSEHRSQVESLRNSEVCDYARKVPENS